VLYSNEDIENLRHRWTSPKGQRILKTVRESRCYLSPVLFREKVHGLPRINDPAVADSVDLRGAPLSGFDFRISVQEDDSGFSERMVVLSNIHFEGAIIRHCNFEEGRVHDCFFENTDLSFTEFKTTNLTNCNFQEADMTDANLRGAKLTNCDFSNATIKDVLMDTTIVDEKTTFGKILKSEKEESFHLAAIEYKQIKEMYKNSSLHQQADDYHYKEMVTKRKSIPLRSPKRWLAYIFGDLLCKYGISYTRVIAWGAAIVVSFASVGHLQKSLMYNNSFVETSFSDALYFSLVTFTTLGYGDFHATGAMRFFAGIESFIGATLMSLFTVIVARKIIRD